MALIRRSDDTSHSLSRPHGIVVFAFGQRAREPGPVNERLAQAVAAHLRAAPAPTVVVAQWEVTKALTALGVTVDRSVERDDANGDYLDSQAVWAVARRELTDRGIQLVVPFAHPFLHMHKVRLLIERDGFTVVRPTMSKVGFDSTGKNLQPWTRGPLRLLTYAIRQAISGHQGPS